MQEDCGTSQDEGALAFSPFLFLSLLLPPFLPLASGPAWCPGSHLVSPRSLSLISSFLANSQNLIVQLAISEPASSLVTGHSWPDSSPGSRQGPAGEVPRQAQAPSAGPLSELALPEGVRAGWLGLRSEVAKSKR